MQDVTSWGCLHDWYGARQRSFRQSRGGLGGPRFTGPKRRFVLPWMNHDIRRLAGYRGALLLINGPVVGVDPTRMPVSTASIYLGVGLLVGPWGFDLLRLDLGTPAVWFEAIHRARGGSVAVRGRATAPAAFLGCRMARRLATGEPLDDRDDHRCGGHRLVGARSITGAGAFVGRCWRPPIPCSPARVTVGHSEDHDRVRLCPFRRGGAERWRCISGCRSRTPLARWRLALDESRGLGPARSALGHSCGSRHRLLHGPTGRGCRNRSSRATQGYQRAHGLPRAGSSSPCRTRPPRLLARGAFLSVFAAGEGLRRAELRTVEQTPHPDSNARDGAEHPRRRRSSRRTR